jgi:hypothetical protein
MRSIVLPFVIACTLVAPLNAFAADEPARTSKLQDPSFFPLCVWVQAPSNAARYRAAGINTYVGLWRGPTDEQLAELKQQGMHLICHQNATALKHKDDSLILAWMHGDEPDNAQAKKGGGGYGPPIAPEKIVEDYTELKATDPSRPILLNLGQGVAWDNWIGRGVRRNHPEDYPEYVKGCDIASFDIYPACHDNPEVAGKLWFVADGVSRLKKWTTGRQQVWNCIECTHVENPKAKATPQQVKAEVWMSIVRGSRGIIYFCHQFKPTFIEAGMLADADMVAGITKVNQQIKELAPVINSSSLEQGLTVTSSTTDVPVEAVLKHHRDARYVFAVGMRDGTTRAKFQLTGVQGPVEVLGENRQIKMTDGAFEDDFRPWDVHLYRIP